MAPRANRKPWTLKADLNDDEKAAVKRIQVDYSSKDHVQMSEAALGRLGLSLIAEKRGTGWPSRVR